MVLVVKNLPVNAGDARDFQFDLWVGKIPWRRAWQPTPVFLPGESHGQSNLEGYNPYSCRVGHDRHSIAGKGNTIGPAQIRIKIHFAKHQKQN